MSETTTFDPTQHALTLVQDVTREAFVRVDKEGNLVRDGEFETLDVHEDSLWCCICGRLRDDQYVAHGVSDDWYLL